jgi:protocatechuate 3,4-dioxygenase beta subunit
MHHDDKPMGRILSRREVLALFGVTGAGLVAARAAAQPGSAGTAATDAALERLALAQAPACVVRPQQTEGPYFVDAKLGRSDIRSDPATGVASAGLPLALRFRVFRVGAGQCVPMSGAIVDVWQCDADGVYSDVRDTNNFFNTVGKKFLRGFQTTDTAGSAEFTTIYPGWYQGRAVHIHFKIRTSRATRAQEFTSQLYFDDALNQKVFAVDPYAKKGVRGLVPNDRDGIFRRGGGQLVLDAKPQGEGYAATFDVGLNVG